MTVSPRIDASISSAGATGSVRPAAAGAAVQLQRAAGTGWTTVSSTVTDGTGAFTFGGPLAPGDYRVRCAPGGGLQPGPLDRGHRVMRRLAALVVLALALVAASAAAAFENTEPLAAQQWYLTRDSAWDFWPTPPKTLAPVKVAVIDSGIDGGHPDLRGRVVAARSFVGGSPYRDEEGHGTFVAGEIAANPFNGIGIAGMAFNARLIVAKVVEPDGTVSLAAEVAAIRWAVKEGARVINLSLGGVRDPLDPELDTYSSIEQAAVEYAYSKGAVVVAAVGNGPQSPATPWDFAHYPSALPHVIGVSALDENGSVPTFSNRDAVFNDIAAPGANIVSTIPRQLVEPAGGVSRRAVLGLWAVRVQRRDRHVVRRAAGLGRRRAPARRRSEAQSRPGVVAARAKRRRRLGRDGLPGVPGRPRHVLGLGQPRRPVRAHHAHQRDEAAAARPLRAERRGRCVVTCATAASADDRRVARLLGRQRRRLPLLPAARAGALCAAHAGDEGGDPARRLEPRHEAGRGASGRPPPPRRRVACGRARRRGSPIARR